MKNEEVTEYDFAKPFEMLWKDILFIKKVLSERQNTNERKVPVLPEILSLKEAAEFLRLSVSKLYQLTSKNEVPFYKQGSRVLFKRSDLLKWLDKFYQIDTNQANDSADSFIASKR
jgi:excisionase family DNA binding protein